MSMNIYFSDIAQYDESASFSMNAVINQISIDTRTIYPGQTYLAITGDHFDGHDFISEAVDKGAASVIISCDVKIDLPVLKVSNTVNTLGLIAGLYRDRLAAVIIGITGSNGKTTVKQMLKSICQLYGKTTATIANNNNAIGVPLTLFSAACDDKFVIIEVGTSRSGEIPYLADIIRSDISIITNISESHLSGIGRIDNVFIEKSALIQRSKTDGSVIVNLDDSYSESVLSLVSERVNITYGFSCDADVHVIDQEQSTITVTSPKGELTYRLNVPGKHNISNSMAAVSLAQAAGINNDLIVAGLEKFTGVEGRLQIQQLPNNITLIDDTYNANLASSYAALDVLATYTGRKLFAYGGMAELGKNTKKFHRNIGEKAKNIGVDQLYICGKNAQPTYKEFLGNKFYFDKTEDLSKSLADQLTDGDTVLVKGSRCYRMDHVTRYLLEKIK